MNFVGWLENIIKAFIWFNPDQLDLTNEQILGETYSQISSHDLWNNFRYYEGPFKVVSRGNGHHDLYGRDNKYLAHVHCWDLLDYKDLAEFIEHNNKILDEK